ncbi:MAG: DUF1573 domain-containing protein [Chthoniobacterales bacterium]|nr:DUF1573 domain-containing protein [Chthoniobacterales bacterium]
MPDDISSTDGMRFAPGWAHPRGGLCRGAVVAVLILGFTQPGWGMLAWEAREASLYPGPLEESASASFRFKNTGDKSVEISDVKSSCGCTAAQSGKRIYAPGESGEVTATLNIGNRQGLQVTAITVTTNDGEKPVTLIMKTLIPEVLRIRPTVVWWPRGAAPDSKAINVLVQQDDPVRVVGVESSGDAFDVRLEEVVAGRHYRVNLTPASTAGPATVRLKIRTDTPKDKPRTYEAHVLVK